MIIVDDFVFESDMPMVLMVPDPEHEREGRALVLVLLNLIQEWLSLRGLQMPTIKARLNVECSQSELLRYLPQGIAIEKCDASNGETEVVLKTSRVDADYDVSISISRNGPPITPKREEPKREEPKKTYPSLEEIKKLDKAELLSLIKDINEDADLEVDIGLTGKETVADLESYVCQALEIINGEEKA